MIKLMIPSRRSRLAVIALGAAALALALPLSAHADGKNHGKRHGSHSRSYFHGNDRYYGPPPAYYGGPPPCRKYKRVKVFNHYYPVPVPVAVPVYPAYPQDYDAYDSKPVVRIGVDWVIGF